MVRAVFFDFNGVLVDDEPLHLQLIQKVLGEEGIPLSEETYHQYYLGLDDRSCFAAILRHAGQADDLGLVMRLTARKASYYQAAIREQGYPFFPGAADLVRGCRDAGWMLGVVSGALHEEVEGALAQENLRDHFKVVLTAEDVQAGKPDPEGYLLGLERFNAQPPLPDRLIHPHEVLVIEDTPPGLRAAGAAGLSTLAVAHTYPAATLEEISGTVEDSISALTVTRLQAL
jgi:HAD superfamily hydrolase (TIGR01509 family)